MIYRVTHETVYEYREPVSVSHHWLRLEPRQLPRQKRLEHRLSLSPPPRASTGHTDYFGNAARFIIVEGEHQELRVRSESTVELAPRPGHFHAEMPAWESVREFSRGCQIGAGLEANEFVFDSPLVAAAPMFANYAALSFARGRPILEAVLDLTRRIHEDFKFDPTATTVATPLREVFQKRRGVCQDFAHLQIACLRSLGLPARYVSGYLETLPPPGKPRLAGADASHAWISFFCHGLGWIDVDPTNNLLPSLQHVTVAWGRDFSDVSPLRGVIMGSGEHAMRVAVDVVRQEEKKEAENSSEKAPKPE